MPPVDAGGGTTVSSPPICLKRKPLDAGLGRTQILIDEQDSAVRSQLVKSEGASVANVVSPPAMASKASAWLGTPAAKKN